MDIWEQVEVCAAIVFATLHIMWINSIVHAIKSTARDLAAIKKLLAEQKGTVEQISDNLAEVGNHIIEQGGRA